MKCPNCGFEQPEGQECAKCGIVFKKHLQRLDILQDPAAAIKKIVASFAGQIQYKKIFFAPRIPEDLLCQAWLKCADKDAVDPEEEVLMLGHERLPLGGSPDILIVTTRGIIVSPTTAYSPTGFDYGRIREIGLTGLFADKLTIDGQGFSFNFLVNMQANEGKEMEKMFREILNVSRSASQNGSWKPRVEVALDREDVPEGFVLRQAGRTPISMADAEVLAKGDKERLGADLISSGMEQIETPALAGKSVASRVPEASPMRSGSPDGPLSEVAHGGDGLTLENKGGDRLGLHARPVRTQGVEPAPIIATRDKASRVTGGWKLLAHAVGLFAGMLAWPFAKGLLAGKFKVNPQTSNWIGMAIGFLLWQGIAHEIIEAVWDWKRRRKV